jgi:hypothetical protein
MENRFVVLSLLEDLQHWPLPPPDDFTMGQPLQEDGNGGRDENLLSAGSVSDHNEEPRSRQRARCHAVRHLVALARKMGPRWTNSEVVPFLLRCLDEEDAELAAAVAEVVVGLVAVGVTGTADAASCVTLDCAMPVLAGLSVCSDEGVRRSFCMVTLPSVVFGCPFPNPGLDRHDSETKDAHTLLVELAAMQQKIASSSSFLKSDQTHLITQFRLLLKLLDNLLTSKWSYARACAATVIAHILANLNASAPSVSSDILTRPLLPRSIEEGLLLRRELLQARIGSVAALCTALDLSTELKQRLFSAGLLEKVQATGGRVTSRVRLATGIDTGTASRHVTRAMIEAVPLLVAGHVMSVEEALLSLQDVPRGVGRPEDVLAPLTEDFLAMDGLLCSLSALLRVSPNADLSDVIGSFVLGIPVMTAPLLASRSWKVRFTATRRLCTDLMKELFNTVADASRGHTRAIPDLLRVLTDPPVLGQLFSDCEEEVRAEAALVAGRLVQYAVAPPARAAAAKCHQTLELLVEQVLSSLQCAIVDESDRVRAAAASSLATIALALGDNFRPVAVESATNMLLDLVRDDQMVVQLAVIGEISNVLSHSCVAKRIQSELVKICQGLAGNANWRVRESYAKVLVCMCQHFLIDTGHHSQAAAFAASELLPLLVDVLFDKAHAVRQCAAERTAAMCGHSEHVKELVWSTARASPRPMGTYQGRASLLQLGISLQLDVKTLLLPMFDQFGRDPVPNVRMIVAKELAKLLCPNDKPPRLTVEDKAALLPLLRLLVEDSSADVRECAAKALEKCF